MAMSIFSKLANSIVGGTLIDKVREQHAARISAYKKAYRFYTGEIYDTTKPVGETWAKLNYARAFVNTHAEQLIREGIEFSLEEDNRTTEKDTENRTAIDYVMDAWRYSDQAQVLSESALYGALTGDVCLRLSWLSKEDMVKTGHGALFADEVETGFPRIQVVPPQYFFPTYDSPGSTTFSSVMIILPKNAPAGDKFLTLDQLQKATLEIYAEHWTATELTIYDGQTRIVKQNPLGFIPIVHIRSYPKANSSYGMSDVADMLDTCFSHNVRHTEAGDILTNHASPLTIVQGAALDQLERGPDKVWSVPDVDAKVYNLEIKGDGYKAAELLLEREYTAMHELAHLPVGILGSLDTGNSAVATVLKFQPMMSRRAMKVASYKSGFELLNRMILHMGRLADSKFANEFEKMPARSRYFVKVTFPNTLPREESLELDRSAKRLQLGISSRREELTTRYGYSPGEANRIIEENLADRMADADVERIRYEGAGLAANLRPKPTGSGDGNPATPDPPIRLSNNSKPRSGNPDPQRPNPEVQGESNSRNRSSR